MGEGQHEMEDKQIGNSKWSDLLDARQLLGIQLYSCASRIDMPCPRFRPY